MIDAETADIDAKEIMKKIHEEVANRKAEFDRYEEESSIDWKSIYREYEDTPKIEETKIWHIIKKIQYKLQKYPFYSFIYRIAIKLTKYIPKYHEHILIDDILKYHDEEFINNVYRIILKRESDLDGSDYYLSKLRNGDFDKIDIIRKLRYSKEGKEKNVKIKSGLRFLANSIYHIPVIGYIFRLLVTIVMLPKILRDIQKYEAFTNQRFTQCTNNLNKLSDNLEHLSQKTEKINRR